MAKILNDEKLLKERLDSTESAISDVRSEIRDISGHLSDVSFGYNFPNDAPMEIRENQSNALRDTLHFKEAELESLLQEREKIVSELSKLHAPLMTNQKPMQNYSISKYTISPLPQPINGTVAVASVAFYNTLIINGITINEGKNGLYVKMPQKRTKQGNYIDVAHPLSTDGRRNINETLLSGYRSGNFKQEFVTPMPKNIAAQNSVKYPPEYGNSLARLDIVVDDMVVHNAKIIKSNDVERLFMPTYKAKDGNYTSICAPASKEAFATFNSKALEEFNTEYTFGKFSDSDVANLKESGISIQSHKNDKGENIVKFKAEDLQKVNAIVQHKPTVAPKMS